MNQFPQEARNKMVILFLFFSIFSRASETLIISDYDFTNQKYTWDQTVKFIRQWPRNDMSLAEIEPIYRNAVVWRIHVLVVITRMECEKGLIQMNPFMTNKTRAMFTAMGYGHDKMFQFKKDGKWFYKFGGYHLQLYKACEKMRRDFDIWIPGRKVILLDRGEWIAPKNGATYVQYRYTPYYGKHTHFKGNHTKYEGQALTGNLLFEVKFCWYKKLWDKMSIKK